MRKIERSTGLYTGYMGYMCGNGYEGLTRELDDTVKREAELLSEAFNKDVEIRFNSDRESGGAWLKNSLKGFDGNCQIGLNAGIRYKGTDIYIETFVTDTTLRDPSLANSGNPDSRYCSLRHNSAEEALAWLVANIDTNKLSG